MRAEDRREKDTYSLGVEDRREKDIWDSLGVEGNC